uniref:Ig-like domain-containing protein n=1 Tax=Sander lucioperca TaxID=283035 RepID=A0A8D0CTK6_SANLU
MMCTVIQYISILFLVPLGSFCVAYIIVSRFVHKRYVLTVHFYCSAGSVILESSVLPVMEGETVTLRCRNKTSSTNLPADFYKDGRLMKNSSGEEMTIKNVSKSDERLYKCSISGAGESPETGSVILESPALPVMEGEAVTLSCRTKLTSFSSLITNFYKDGRLIRSSPTGNLTIESVFKSHDGHYKCNIPGAGESPESQLAVKGKCKKEIYIYNFQPFRHINQLTAHMNKLLNCSMIQWAIVSRQPKPKGYKQAGKNLV